MQNDYAVHKYCLVQLQGYRSKRTFGQRAVPFGSNLAQHGMMTTCTKNNKNNFQKKKKKGDLLHFPDLARLVTQSMRRMSIMQTVSALHYFVLFSFFLNGILRVRQRSSRPRH